MMKPRLKKIIAKEWLTLMGFLLIGFTALPALIMAFGGQIKMGLFYSALFSGSDRAISWLVALSPYILYQFLRSLIWAIRTLKTSSP
jgi:hypothetical protein